MYRLIISEKGRDLYGKPLEILGSYNPHSKELQAKDERIQYWLGKGAQMSPSVNNLLVDKKIITGDKVKASKPGKPAEKPAEEAPATAPTPSVEAPTETPAETPAEAVIEEPKEEATA